MFWLNIALYWRGKWHNYQKRKKGVARIVTELALKVVAGVAGKQECATGLILTMVGRIYHK